MGYRGSSGVASSVRRVYDAIVAPLGGDYPHPAAAIAAGEKSILVRDGTYVLTANLAIPSGTCLVGEHEHATILDGDGKYRMYMLGDGGGERYSVGAIRAGRGDGYMTGLTDELGQSPDWAALTKDTLRLMGTTYDDVSFSSGAQVDLARPYCGPSVDWDAFDYDLAVERANYYIGNMTLQNADTITDSKTGLLYGVSAHGIVLERLRIIGSGANVVAQEPRGIYLFLCEDVTIVNCHVSHTGAADGISTDLFGGITVAFSWAVSIRGNRVHDCHQNGIFLRACKHSYVAMNHVGNCANAGIWDCESVHTSTVSNLVTNCYKGIVSSAYNTIQNNDVTDTLIGIDVSAWPERLDGYPYSGSASVVKGGMGTKGSVSGNIITRARRYGIYNYGSHTVIGGNQIDEQGLLRNGDFREWYKPVAGASLQPYNWSATPGVWGTDVAISKCDDHLEAAVVLDPMFAPQHVKFLSNGLKTITIRQELRYRPEVSSNLYLSFWARKYGDGVASLTAILYDPTGTARITLAISESDLTTTGWKWFPSAVYATGTGPLAAGWYVTITVVWGAGHPYHAIDTFHLDGIRLTDDTCAGIYSQGMSAIQGNVLRGCGAVIPGTSTRAAITSSKGSYDHVWPPNGDVVTGNIIDNCGQIACNLTNDGAMFTGNRLRGFGLYGFHSQGSDRVVVTGNYICQGSGSFGSNDAGVYLINATNTTVVGNTLYIANPIWVAGGGGHVLEHNLYNRSWGMRVQANGGGVALSTAAYRVNEGMLLSAPTTASVAAHWHVKIGSGLLTVRDHQYEYAIQDDYNMAGTLAATQSVIVAVVAYESGGVAALMAVPGTIVSGAGAVAPTDAVIGAAIGTPGWMRVGTTLLVTDGSSVLTQTYNNAVRETP